MKKYIKYIELICLIICIVLVFIASENISIFILSLEQNFLTRIITVLLVSLVFIIFLYGNKKIINSKKSIDKK